MSRFLLGDGACRFYNAVKSAFRKKEPGAETLLAQLFDAAWYAKRFDKKELPLDLFRHYLTVGYMTGNPNPMFDTGWYVSQHPELKSGDKNPFIYYLEMGESAGDAPSPQFDPAWYLEKYPDVAAAKVSPLAHFLQFGAAEGRLPKRPAPYRSYSQISSALADLAASLSARYCSIELPVKSLDSLQDFDDVTHVKNLYRVRGDFCEGVNGSPEFPRSAYVSRIENSLVVAGTRYILDSSGVVLHDENANFIGRDDVAIKYDRAEWSTVAGTLSLNVGMRQGAWVEKGLNVMHEYENNYFHFIAETLPRMILAEEAGILKEIPYLLTGDLHPNIQKLFSLANGSQRAVVPLERGTLYRVGEMYFPSDLTSVIDAYQGGRAARQSGLDIKRIRIGVDRCRSFFPGTDAKKRKIFATRGGSYRRLINQEKIKDRMVALGFEVVDTNEIDLEAQIRMFQDAEVIVGPTGAQMSNMVWCRPGAKVLILASDHPSHQLYFWELLGRVSGATVTILQGPRAYVRNDIYSLHDDYTVDEDAVIEETSRLM